MDFTVTLTENLVERIEPLLADGQTIEQWIAGAALVNALAHEMSEAFLKTLPPRIRAISPNAARIAGRVLDTPDSSSGP